MKPLLISFRLYLAEWLLGKVYDIAPKCKEGEGIKLHVANYFQIKDKQQWNRNVL